jgi:dienelactone hydrolase
VNRYFLVRTALIASTMLAGAAFAQQGPQPSADMVRDMAAQRALYAQMPDTPGTGPFAALKEVVPSLSDHVVYHPANLAALGNRKLGILVWGNGGCSDDGASARLHLAEIASHGYLAIAPGAILSGPGAPPPKPMQGFDSSGKLPPVKTTAGDVTKSIDWAYAENERRGSPFYHRLDLNRVAVSGHSCGGLQALLVAADPRVRAVVINNSGVFADGSNPIRGMEVDKSILKRLHTPVLYILGGPTDIAYPNGMDDFAKIDSVPVMVANLSVGHGGTFTKPNGGAVAQVALKWLDWQLSGDKEAAKMFVGKDCGLCTDPAWTVDRKRIG